MIEFTKNKAKIQFSNLLYFPAVLGLAVEDFKLDHKIMLDKGGLSSSVVIEGPDEDQLRILAYEFCNYALALMKDRFVESAHYDKK